MSCNTKTSLAAVIDAVNAQLDNNYVDRDDPRINQGVFTEPTIRGGLMLDEAAKLDFCGYVTECGQREPFGKQWVDRPLYPYNTLVSYEDEGEIKSRWQDIDDVVAGTEIGESYTTYAETRSLGLQGYTIIDSFELGETITQRNQALRHAATGKLYRWAGDLPKIVPAGSTPVSSGGVGTNAWLEVSDTALRQEILTGGLITDTIVTATPNGTGAVARTQREVNADSVSVKSFGAKGNGVADDTLAIQAAIDHVASLGGGTVTVPDGTYMIKADNPDSSASHYLHDEGGIALKDNVHLKLSAATTLKAIPTNERRYNVVRSFNKNNVAISGGRILGERDQHIAGGQVGEWGYGIAVTGSEEVSISDIDVVKCYGDGINLQLAYINDVPISPKGVYIDKVRSLHNRRQGMSIEAGYDVFITKSEFSHTGGTEPSSGIDIEPWSPDAVVKNISIDGCRFVDNAKKGIIVGGAGDISDIRITNNFLSGNQAGVGAGQITVYTPQTVHKTRDIKVEGNTVIGGGNCIFGIIVFDSEDVVVAGNTLTDCMLGLSGFAGNKNIVYSKNIVTVSLAQGAVQLMNFDEVISDSSYKNIQIVDNTFNFMDAVNAGADTPVFYIRGHGTIFARNKLIGLSRIKSFGRGVVIEGNHLHNFAGTGIEVLGEGTIVENNKMYNISFSQYGDASAIIVSAIGAYIAHNALSHTSAEYINPSYGTHKVTNLTTLTPTLSKGSRVVDNTTPTDVGVANWGYIELDNIIASSVGFSGPSTPITTTRPIGFRFYNTTSKKELVNQADGWYDLMGVLEPQP